MKRSYLLLFLIGCLSLAGCTDTLHDETGVPREGLPAEITLSLGVNDDEIVTRAVSSDTEEKKLYNLYVLIFNADGTRSTGQYIEFGETPEKIRVVTRSGSGKRIYGIANIGRGMMEIDAATLDEVRDEAELNALDALLQQQVTSRGTNFLMTGFIEDTAGQIAPVTIPEGVSASPLGKIRLRRVDSKITFRIRVKDQVTFTPDSWRVLSAPQRVSLFPAAPGRFPDPEHYFDTDWKRFEGENTEWDGRTFAFYVLENKHDARRNATGAGLPEKYACREKQEKIPVTGSSLAGQTCRNGDWVYAPLNGTYIEMKGHISYQNNGVDISADVIYTIHLGYKGTDPDDYSALRNTHYTYNVTINSVDNILLEVQTGNETQPGAEGSVTLAGSIVSVDAHYETRLMSISSNLIDQSLSWSVKTPFSEGLATDHPKDYKWILFRLNSYTGNEYNITYPSFPGETSGLFTGSTLADFLGNKDKLLNVDQLVTLLKECRLSQASIGNSIANNLFDKNSKILFTAFINENYYYVNPENPADAPVDLWKRFVNQPERVLNILSGNQYSPDGESQKTEAVISFRQAAIQTMYNVKYPAVNTAWGTEMIQDDDIYQFWTKEVAGGSNQSYKDRSNGLANTMGLWGIPASGTGGDWSTYVRSSTGEMQTTYQYARYMCMRQNRDNNGDGKVNRNEVKWYLASINQLSDIWIGENSFDLTARLYKKTFWDQQNQWFVSSTVEEQTTSGSGFWKKYYDNPIVLWASEGSSIGPMRSASTDRLYYRCVRNLGIPDGDTTVPDDFASYNTSTGELSLDKLDSRSVRDQYETAELSEHHEREADNKPWWTFQVEKAVRGSNLNWLDVRNAVNTGKSPCLASGSGWRVPNQRELALMQSRIGNDNYWKQTNHMSRTRFSFNPTGGLRHGFAVTNNAGILFMINNNNERGGVRCVRDVVK